MDKVFNELRLLFEEAKQRNEFEFVLTLINYRGIGREDVTNLYEWFDAIEFYKSLYYQFSGKEKTRMGALIYSTFFENNDFYNILGSLCNISLGFKGSSYLFYKTKKQDRLLGTGEKISFILELLSDCNKETIITFFFENHIRQIRDTFFHSAYSLWDNNYILFDTDPVLVEGSGHMAFDVTTFLYPKVENIIQFFDAFKNHYLNGFACYKEDKIVKGFFPNLIEATIIGSGNGLKGFEIKNTATFYGVPVNSGIYYDETYGMWVGRNITIDFPNLETVEIQNRLARYEGKDDIKKTDSEFQNLVDKVADRKIAQEIDRAVVLLIKFGNVRYEKMKDETNDYRKKSFPRIILPYYKRAIEINVRLNMAGVKEKIKELEQE